jgi:predicted dehydrogenase
MNECDVQMREVGRTVRIAVVGIGKMGLLHACILNALPGVKLEAVCDKSALIRRLSNKVLHDIQFVDDLYRLTALGLDGVYITTPIPSHFALAKAVYSEKIAPNLFIEKTLASNYTQAKELCELASVSGGVNIVGYMKRFSVTFNKAKEMLGQATLGRLSSFQAHAYSSDFADVRKGSTSAGARGGVLSDLGSHVIDLALWFFQDLKVESARLKSSSVPGSEDAVEFEVMGPESLEGNFDVSWCLKEYHVPEFGLTVHGDKGNMTVSDDEVILEASDGKMKKWYRHDLGDNVEFLLGEPEYCQEDKHFVSSILENRKSQPDFVTASRVDEIIEQVRGRINIK